MGYWSVAHEGEVSNHSFSITQVDPQKGNNKDLANADWRNIHVWIKWKNAAQISLLETDHSPLVAYADN